METIEIKKKLMPVNVKKVLEGRNLILKPITHNEITKKYLSWVNDEKINQFLEVRFKSQDFMDLINYVNNLRKQEKCELFAIFLKKSGLHVGNASITNYNTNGRGDVDFGIMIGDERAQTLGLGGETHILLLEYFFSDPDIIRINGGAASRNDVAWRTMESLGYLREGVRRKIVPLPNNERCDVYWYGILRQEWIEQRAKFKSIIKCIEIKDL